MKTNNSKYPAFPCYDPYAPASTWACGLTKREYFALEFAKAMTVNAGSNGYRARLDRRILRDALLSADALLELLHAGS